MTEQPNLIPKRRFKEFQNTGTWEQRTLGDMSSSFDYGLNASATLFDGINKYIRITDIDDISRRLNQSTLTSPNIDLSNADNYLIKTGDILFARTGASVGKTYRYQEEDGKVYYAGFLIRARIKQDFDSEFIFQNTLTPKYQNFIKVTSQRSGQPGVNAQEYSRFDLMVPTLGEQQKIGVFFKALDGTLALHQRKLEKLKALKSAYLLEMFPTEGECKPKRRFAGFTQAWEQHKLGEVATFINGRAYKQQELLDSGKYKVLRVGNFYTNSSWYYSDLELGEKYYAENGDLLYTWSASFGPHIWYGDKVIYHYHIWKIDLSNKLDKQFTIQLLEYDKAKILNDKNGSTMVHITKKGMEGKKVLLPSVEEQTKIGNFFKQLDQLITFHEQKLKKLQNLKRAYLCEMFV